MFKRLFNLLSACACVVFWEPNVEFFQHGGRVQVNTDADFVYVVDAFNVKAGVKYALDNNSIIEIQYPGPCGTFQWGSYTFCTCDTNTGGINCREPVPLVLENKVLETLFIYAPCDCDNGTGSIEFRSVPPTTTCTPPPAARIPRWQLNRE